MHARWLQTCLPEARQLLPGHLLHLLHAQLQRLPLANVQHQGLQRLHCLRIRHSRNQRRQ